MKKLFNFVLTLLISFNFIFDCVTYAVFARSTRRRGGKINARRNIGKRISKATGGQPVSQQINDKTQPEEKQPEEPKAGACDKKEQIFTDTVDRFRFKTSDKIIFGQSVMLSNLLTPETYEIYNERGSNTACLNEYVCFGPYMSVMGSGGDNISKYAGKTIECFAYRPNSYYSFNILNASDKDVTDVTKTFNRGDLADTNTRVLYIDKKQSGTGQYRDFMKLQTQGYIDFREHYNKIKDAVGNKEQNAETGIFKACKKDLIEDSSYSFEKLYALLVGSSVAEGLATGLSAASMAMSAASSAKTGQLMDDLDYLNTHETKEPQSKIELLQMLAKAKLLRLVMITSNYLSATGDNALFNDVLKYVEEDHTNDNLQSVISKVSSWKDLQQQENDSNENINSYNIDTFHLREIETKIKEVQDTKNYLQGLKGNFPTDNKGLDDKYSALVKQWTELGKQWTELGKQWTKLDQEQKQRWQTLKFEAEDFKEDSPIKKFKDALDKKDSLIGNIVKALDTMLNNACEFDNNKGLLKCKEEEEKKLNQNTNNNIYQNMKHRQVIIDNKNVALNGIAMPEIKEEALNNFIKDIDDRQTKFVSSSSGLVCDNCNYTKTDAKIAEYKNILANLDSENKKAKKINDTITTKSDNVKSMLDSTRGLDIGSAVTSAFAAAGGAVGMGTSITAAVRVKTTINRWKTCKKELNNLQTAYNTYKSYRDKVFPGDTNKDKKKSLDKVEGYTPAIENILGKCKLPDAEKTLNKVRAETIGTSATATVGTVTSIGATVASSLAATKADKTKGHLNGSGTGDNKYSKAKEEAKGLKASRTAGAVLSAIGTAVAGVATGLSAASSVKLEKLKDDAKLCATALNEFAMNPTEDWKGFSQGDNQTTGEENHTGNNPAGQQQT